VLEAVVLLLTIVVVGNLLLTWGMVRRLRNLQEQVGLAFGPLQNGLAPGDPAPDFFAVTASGDRVTRDELVRSETVLAFFSPTCSACESHIPSVRQLAGLAPGSGPAVVAVVDGRVDESSHLVDEMEGDVVMVFAPRSENDLLEDYRVNAYPSYYVISPDGRITNSHMDLSQLLSSSEP
jgi:peroxiredoxin